MENCRTYSNLVVDDRILLAKIFFVKFFREKFFGMRSKSTAEKEAGFKGGRAGRGRVFARGYGGPR